MPTHVSTLFDSCDLWSVIQSSLVHELEDEITIAETRYGAGNRTPLLSYANVRQEPGGRRDIRGFLSNGIFYLTRPPVGLVSTDAGYARQITLGRPLKAVDGELRYYPHVTELDGLGPTVTANKVPHRRLPGSEIFEKPKSGTILLHRLSKTTSIRVNVTLYGVIPAISELLSLACNRPLGLLVLVPARVATLLIADNGKGSRFYHRATQHVDNSGDDPPIYKLVPPRSLFHCDAKPTQIKLVNTVARLSFDPGFLTADQVAEHLASPPNKDWEISGNKRFQPLSLSKHLQLAALKPRSVRSRFLHLLPVLV